MEKTDVWAPSESAMKGRRDQSFSVAGSVPSAAPNQASISGPLAGEKTLLDSRARIISQGVGVGALGVVESNHCHESFVVATTGHN